MEPVHHKDFSLYYDRYRNLIYRNFLVRTGSEGIAEDLTQETFLHAARGFPPEPSGPSFSWLMKIADNVFKNWLRYHGAGKRDGVEDPLEDRFDAPLPNPEKRLISKEELRAVGKAIGLLPPQMKRCFTMFYLEEYKYHEIAALLDIDIQTVKSQLNRGRKKVVESLNAMNIGIMR